MSSPRSHDWMLKKMARYLVKHRRIAIDFRFQNDANCVDGYPASDQAGCTATKKSTTGGCMMFGTHTLRTWSSTQAVVAVNSGEAEFYAVVRCVCELLRLQGLLRDLGMPMNIQCFTDSSAARGVAMRRWVGKFKHLETKTLWVQDQVAWGIAKINKVSANLADLMTKYISGIKVLLSRMGMKEYSRRHHLAPQLQGDSAPLSLQGIASICGHIIFVHRNTNTKCNTKCNTNADTHTDTNTNTNTKHPTPNPQQPKQPQPQPQPTGAGAAVAAATATATATATALRCHCSSHVCETHTVSKLLDAKVA